MVSLDVVISVADIIRIIFTSFEFVVGVVLAVRFIDMNFLVVLVMHKWVSATMKKHVRF